MFILKDRVQENMKPCILVARIRHGMRAQVTCFVTNLAKTFPRDLNRISWYGVVNLLN